MSNIIPDGVNAIEKKSKRIPKNKIVVRKFANVPAPRIAICENFFFFTIIFSSSSTNAAGNIGKK